ncbi:hypothetical protein Tco_1266116 [Tanacetum coccineum]
MLNHALLAGYCSYKNLTSKLKIEKTRPKKYPELTEAQQLQDDCDVQATKIVVHGLPPDVYALVNHQKAGETLYEYYWRFSQLINDMHAIGMTMQQVQVNTKFLNALPSKWSKFITNVKLAKSLYTTNSYQLYAYHSQHERHAQEVHFMHERYPDPLALNLAFQTEDLDAYDSACDDFSSAKAVLMANLSSCDSDVLSEVPYSDTYPNDMINQDVQEMTYSEQTHLDDFLDTEINSDSNIIPYSQYLQESQDAGIQDTNSSVLNDLLVLSLVEQITDHVANLDKENQINKMVNESLTAELERYKERVPIFEQRQNVDLHKREKIIDSQMDDLIRNRNAKLVAFQHEIDTLKETLSTHVKEKKSLSKILIVFKTESKEKE